MTEYVAAQAAVLLVPSLKGFKSRLDAQLKTIKGEVEVEADLQLAQARAEMAAFKKEMAAKPVVVDISVKDTDGTIKKKMTEIRHNYDSLSMQFKKGLLLNIKVVGAQQLPLLGTALAAVNQSVVELSQSTLLLPGILSAAASSFGTLLTGVSGVKDAFKSFSDAQKDSVNESKRMRDGTRAVVDAQRSLTQATRDAQRSLKDLNLELKGASLNEAEAILSVQEAQQEAANAFGKSALERQRDSLRVAQAEQRLAEVRLRNNNLQEDAREANAKGVQGTESVIKATEQLAKAQEELSSGGNAQKTFLEDLKNLSPNAQAFVKEVGSMRGAWTEFKFGVQDKLFAGLGAEVVNLANNDLPILRKGFEDIATSLNGNFKTAINQLQTSGNQDFLTRILGNSAEAQASLDKSLKPLLDAFLRLAAVGSDSLPRLSDGLGRVMERFDNFITKADEDGRLQKWIDRGIEAAKDLGNSFINLGTIMAAVAEAFGDSGGKGFLSALETGTKKLATFLKSAEGQQQLKTFFIEVRDELRKWEPVFANIIPMLKGAAEGAGAWAQTILPFLRTASTLLSQHPGLVSAIMYAYLGFNSLKPVFTMINGALSLMGVNAGEAFKKLGSKAINKAGTLVGGLVDLGSLIAVGGPIAAGLGAVAATLAGQYLTAQNNAALAAQHHADQLARVKSYLDEVTGSLTKQGAAQQLADASRYQNPHIQDNRGNPITMDIPALAESLKIDRNTLLQSTDPTQQETRDKTLKYLESIATTGLANEDFWKTYGPRLEDQGVTLETMAKALAGDQDAINKFNYARDHGSGTGDLNAVRSRLQNKSVADAGVVGGYIREQSGYNLRGGAEARANNDAINGSVNLRPGNPFEQLGSPRAQNNSVGGLSIHVDRTLDEIRANNPQLLKDIEANGGSLVPLLNGTRIDLTPDRAKLYTGPVLGRASGGKITGPGGPKSDSILARLSNGEFVAQASSVAKYGAGLFHALNSGSIDPEMLPRFDSGGEVIFDPTDPTLTSPGLSSPGGAMTPDQWNSSNPATPGFFSGVPQAPSPSPAPSPSSPGRVPAPITDQITSFWPVSAGPVQFSGPKRVPAFPDSVKPSSPSRDPVVPWLNGAPKPRGGLSSLGSVWTSPSITSKPKPEDMGDVGKDGKKPTPHHPGASPGAGAPPGPVPHHPGASPGVGSPPGPVPHGAGPSAPGPGVPAPSAGSVPAPAGINIPPNLEPMSILKQIGKVFLDAVLGFFGIDPTYINMALGLIPDIAGQRGGGANSQVGQILDAYGNPVADTTTGYPGQSVDPQQQPFVGPLSADMAGASERAAAMAELMNGKPYLMGGATLDSTDCSGFAAYVMDAYLGRPWTGRKFSTINEGEVLAANGAILIDDPSKAPPGTLRFGWYDRGGGENGHTAMTLPDGRNAEASGSGPIAVGGGAGGYNQSIFDHWAYFPAFASGGHISGPGGPRSDSILARVSNGEFVTNAASVKKYGAGLFHALNSGGISPDALPRFDDGGFIDPFKPPVPPPAAPNPVPVAPTPPAPEPAPPNEADNPEGAALSTVGKMLSGAGKGLGGGGGGIKSGARGPSGSSSASDPRSKMGEAPQNLDHNSPVVSKSIQAAGSAIGTAVSTAMSAASMAANAGAPGSGQGVNAASSLINGVISAGTGAAMGAVNILSSLGVGTLTGGTTAGAYGTPLTPQGQGQAPYAGPAVVNNWNGGVHTSNNEEFYKIQQRRELQAASSYLPQT